MYVEFSFNLVYYFVTRACVVNGSSGSGMWGNRLY
jgi:hypothetical protein